MKLFRKYHRLILRLFHLSLFCLIVRFLVGKMYMDGMGSNGEDIFHDYRLYYTCLFYTMFEWSYCSQGKNQGKFTRSLLVIKFQF